MIVHEAGYDFLARLLLQLRVSEVAHLIEFVKLIEAAVEQSGPSRRPGWTNALNLLAGSEADDASCHFYLG